MTSVLGGGNGRITSAVLGAALVIALAIPHAAFGASARIVRPSGEARWSGSLSNGSVSDPSMCAPSECPSRRVALDIPTRQWPHRGGGLLVALHWDTAHFDVGYDLDVYVYGPDGSLAAESTTFAFSSDEAAWIQNPPNGTYRVLVAPRTLVGSLDYEVTVSLQRGYTVRERTAYRMRAQRFPASGNLVVPGRRSANPKQLLPDLAPRPPTNFHMESAIGGHFYITGNRGLGHQPPCYPQETLGLDNDYLPIPTGALRCLRFDRMLENRGHGPLELRSYSSEAATGAVYQAVYDSVGGYGERLLPGAVFHPAHGRITLPGFDEVTLNAMAPDGRPGAVVGRMPPAGTCKGDTQNAKYRGRPDGPLQYSTPGSCDTYDWYDPGGGTHPGDSYLRTGISPTWLDTAPWYLPDDYIDVTHVPDGRYLLVARANTNGDLLESYADNNTALACVELEGDTATSCPLPVSAKPRRHGGGMAVLRSRVIRVRGRRARVRLGCPSAASCRGSVRLSGGRRAARFRLAPRTVATVRVVLTARAARRVARQRRVPAVLRLRSRAAGGVHDRRMRVHLVRMRRFFRPYPVPSFPDHTRSRTRG